MLITYDPGKNAVNEAKHGVSLALARKIDWDSVEAEQDFRLNYGEDRYIAQTLIDGRLHVVVFVIRDDALRIISLRKAGTAAGR